jgi:thiamine biosynthesis protein ThiI
VVPFEGVVDQIRAAARPALWQLVLKRCMYRTAEALAAERRAQAIVTGESLGQVSSQTLRNLRALDGRLRYPVLRPLLGLDKEEIIARSREIGTYDISAAVQEYCDIVPEKPATAASVAQLAAEEDRVPLDLQALLAERKVLDVRRLDPEAQVPADLEIDAVPDGAIVLDLRGVAAYRAWHWPEALHLDLQEALRLVPRLERDKTYVAYCELGLKSAHLADRMRAAGLVAYNFRGGLRALLAHAATRDLVPVELFPSPTAPEH